MKIQGTESEEFDKIQKSENDGQLTNFQFFTKFIDFGIITFGSPLCQINVMHKRFVDDLKIIPEQEFFSLLVLCYILPGSVTTQFLIGLAIIIHKSMKGAAYAFAMYTVPMAILFDILALGNSQHLQAPWFPSTYFGFLFAGIAMSMRTIMRFIQNNLGRNVRILLIPLSTYLFSFLNKSWFVLTVFIISGIFGILLPKYSQLSLKKSAKSYDISSQIKNSYIPKITLGAFIISFLPSSLTLSKTGIVFMELYRATFLSICASASEVIQLAGSALKNHKLVNDKNILSSWQRSLIYPGPEQIYGVHLSVGCFQNPIFLTGIIGYLATFIPSVLVILCLMNYYQDIRSNFYLRNMLYTMNFVFVGFFISQLIRSTNEVYSFSLQVYPVAIMILFFIFFYHQNLPSIIVMLAGRLIYPQIRRYN